MIAAAAYCALIAASGFLAASFALEFDDRDLSAARLPTVYYYAAYPVGFALTALGCALAARRALAKKETAKNEVDGGAADNQSPSGEKGV